MALWAGLVTSLCYNAVFRYLVTVIQTTEDKSEKVSKERCLPSDIFLYCLLLSPGIGHLNVSVLFCKINDDTFH